jgi:hypothetical protein
MSGTRSLAAVVLAALIGLGGCGGSSGPSPGAYVKSICTTLGAWKSDVQSASTRLQTSIPATASLVQGKQEYVSFVAALSTATARAAAGLKGAGTPSVSGGSQIAGSLVTAFTQATSNLAAAAAQAAAIPTTSAGAYQAAASGVTAQIRQALAGMTSVTPRKNPQLRSAALKEPACQALQASG